jgi:predicted nuclease of predicted toxin-antitoxin system
VKLLLDEMYSPVIAEQLRTRGHDVASVHESPFRWLAARSDAEVLAAALKDGRALVTENIPDFLRLDDVALAKGQTHVMLIFTNNRQFPRGVRSTTGRLVRALDILLNEPPDTASSVVYLASTD